MKQWGNDGFTLLEIMLAVLILGLVVAMVSFTLSGSLKAIDGTREQGEIYYRAQVALERISDDLSSTLLTDYVDFFGGESQGSTEEKPVLSFASMAHLVFDSEHDNPGLGSIAYFVIPAENDEQQLLLLRSDVLYAPDENQGDKDSEVEAFLLCDRLKSVRFVFINRAGEEVESWDTRKQENEKKTKRLLPAGVKCVLEFWLDRAAETTLTFSTAVVLPTGLIQPGSEGDQDTS